MTNEKAHFIVSEMVSVLRKKFRYTLRPEEGHIIDASRPGFIDLTLYAIAPLGYSEMQAIVDLIGRVQGSPYTRLTSEGEFHLKIEVEFCVPLMKKPRFK